MKITYRVFALIIAALVIVQAAMHAWFSVGVGIYMANGGVPDPSGDSGMQYPEVWGIIIHAANGAVLIPLVAVVFVVIGYLTHTKYGLAFAAVLLVLVVAQVVLGFTGSQLALLGLLHGINAMLIFATALFAERYMSTQMSSRRMTDHPENLESRPAAMI
ncbi:hypothetical protein ACXZ66_03655 [Corynebacterium sp. S7]